MEFLLIKQLGIALLLGSLVGLEREQKSQRYGYDSFAGIRTFALIGLLGSISYILSEYSMSVFAVLTAGFLILLILSYVRLGSKYQKVGATTEIASILIYLTGVFCGMQQYLLAVVVALITLSVLHFKGPLHRWAQHLKNDEIVSAIEFIIVAFVVLPLLPNEYYGPYDFFNPYLVWLMVVLVSGISFVSYIAIKLFGARKGIGFTGFLAGFISSTALALSFSVHSKRNVKVVNSYVVAIVIAGSAMFFRILIEVSVLNSALISRLVVPMAVMGITGIFSVLFFCFSKEKVPATVEADMVKVKSPFKLMPALKFGIFFALILFLSKFADEFMGDKGIYLASVFSGLVDVDAITVSMANMAKSGVAESTAVTAITIAAMVNTLVKGMIFLIFGARKTALRIFAVFALMLVAGGVSLIFV